MDHRAPAWPHHREDYYRYPYQDSDQRWPAPDPRDPRYWAPFNSPPRPEQYPYGPPRHQRPPSRYDYPLHRHWDSRQNYAHYDQDHYNHGHYEHGYYNYGHYEHDYYRRQQEQRDSGQWTRQDLGRSDCFQERASRQDHSGYTEEHRCDQETGISQPFLGEQQNEEDSCRHTGTFASSKHSGLSSSSSELSQYINATEKSQPVTKPLQAAPAGLEAPFKYAVPHAVVSFGPAGQLLRVTPGFSTHDTVSQLEIHSLEVILSESQEQVEMRKFPGPLTREHLHKIESIEFASQKAATCRRDSTLHDSSSAALLWNLLILLCRQHGQIVGCDVAELLVQGSRWDGKQESVGSTLIDFSDSPPPDAPPGRTEDLLTGRSSSCDTSKDALQRYSQLLLAGRKKEALESAMNTDLWGHALFLASKMGSRSYATVLKRFMSQLAATDPLQTLFQVLSGRIPAIATCCGNDKRRDWKPHLAVLLSNETGDPAVQQKAIVTMGDTLASRGLVHAAHVCYLTAGVPFGLFTQKADRLVLIGSSHRQSFQHFATNSAIQCTELYEYCQTLGGKLWSIPSFQVYKFVYATRLLDCGLSAQAFHYCEVVGKAILQQGAPSFVLTGELIKLADRLRHAEDQLSPAGASGAPQEPSWLTELRKGYNSLQMGLRFDPDQPPADGHTVDNTLCSEEAWDDRNSDYCRHSEDQEALLAEFEGRNEDVAASWDSRRAQGPRAISPVPPAVIYASSEPRVAGGQNFSYHNRDSASVTADLPHCLQSQQPSAVHAAGTSSDTVTVSGQVQDVDMSRHVQTPWRVHQSPASDLQTSDQVSPQQSAKAGWFSGWFTSKPKHKNHSEPGSPALSQVPPPPPGQFSPPPPPLASPENFLSRPSAAPVDPSSRTGAAVDTRPT